MYAEMSDEDYILMRELEDKYTKKPTVFELSRAFKDSRYMVGARLYYLKTLGYDNGLMVQYKKLLNLTRQIQEGNELNVEKAKEVPIQSLYDFHVVRETSKRVQCKCPFHDERIGSFYIFKDQNTFHCFSCQSGGDVIAFIQKLNNVLFVEAVKLLNRET